MAPFLRFPNKIYVAEIGSALPVNTEHTNRNVAIQARLYLYQSIRFNPACCSAINAAAQAWQRHASRRTLTVSDAFGTKT